MAKVNDLKSSLFSLSNNYNDDKSNDSDINPVNDISKSSEKLSSILFANDTNIKTSKF